MSALSQSQKLSHKYWFKVSHLTEIIVRSQDNISYTQLVESVKQRFKLQFDIHFIAGFEVRTEQSLQQINSQRSLEQIVHQKSLGQVERIIVHLTVVQNSVQLPREDIHPEHVYMILKELVGKMNQQSIQRIIAKPPTLDITSDKVMSCCIEEIKDQLDRKSVNLTQSKVLDVVELRRSVLMESRNFKTRLVQSAHPSSHETSPLQLQNVSTGYSNLNFQDKLPSQPASNSGMVQINEESSLLEQTGVSFTIDDDADELNNTNDYMGNVEKFGFKK